MHFLREIGQGIGLQLEGNLIDEFSRDVRINFKEQLSRRVAREVQKSIVRVSANLIVKSQLNLYFQMIYGTMLLLSFSPLQLNFHKCRHFRHTFPLCWVKSTLNIENIQKYHFSLQNHSLISRPPPSFATDATNWEKEFCKTMQVTKKNSRWNAVCLAWKSEFSKINTSIICSSSRSF